MTVGAELGQSSLWRDSGGPAVRRGVRVSGLGAISAASSTGKAERPLAGRVTRHLHRVFDRIIASSSLVANDPVLDVRDFPWTAVLRENWLAIRDEAVRVARQGEASSGLATIAPDRDNARSFAVYGCGDPIEDALAHCPHTAAAVARIPGLDSAVFSILAPGTHIPERRGATKGLITCHLGLVVPRDGDVRMRVHDRTLRWAEGETLVFDDTYRHAVWNDTRGTRMVLLIRFERPLRHPGKWIAALLGAVRRATGAQDAARTSGGAYAAVERRGV